jgi:hypothetical protein
MLEALCESLIEKPDQYLGEMVVFLWDEFQAFVITFTISRALKSIGWSKKTCRRVAKGRNSGKQIGRQILFSATSRRAIKNVMATSLSQQLYSFSALYPIQCMPPTWRDYLSRRGYGLCGRLHSMGSRRERRREYNPTPRASDPKSHGLGERKRSHI